MKQLRLRKLAQSLLIAFLIFSPASELFSVPLPPTQEPQVNFLFRDSFYASPTLKLKYDVYEANGFLLVRDSKRGGNSELAIVTGFQDPILESRVLKNIRTVEDANKFLEKNTRKIIFERIPIRELPLISKNGNPASRFWVGQRAFNSLEEAKAKIIEVKAAIETSGGDFDKALTLIAEFFPEEPAPTPQAVHARYQAEEDLALKVLDWLDVGETNYGPMTLVPGHFLGAAPGESILWQSFGETSFRTSNLERGGFNGQVGFLSNRLVFRGLRFLGEPTIDPYVEVTGALETRGANYKDHLDLVAGLEYRPFSRVNFLENFNFDGFYFLKFVRSLRFYVQYMDQKNLTDEITGSPDTDFRAGVDIYYEWGVDLPLPWVVPQRTQLSDWIHDFVWGEYFGNYRYEVTDFSAIDGFNAMVYNSSLTLGIKWPSIPLPKNPINDQLTLMPYIRFEHVTDLRRLDLVYQNRLLIIPGIRWMPFRSYQFEHNEWLFKTKIFAEYVGIGGTIHPFAGDDSLPNHDWRAGVAVSFKRY